MAEPYEYSELLPYVDVEDGLARAMGNEALYHKLLRLFKDVDQVAELTESTRQDDLEVIEQAAHKLKGTAANVGLKKLAEAAGEVGDDARNGKKTEDMSAIHDVWEKTVAMIDRVL